MYWGNQTGSIEFPSRRESIPINMGQGGGRVNHFHPFLSVAFTAESKEVLLSSIYEANGRILTYTPIPNTSKCYIGVVSQAISAAENIF